MWIVLLALRRPYTFVVVAMLIAILGAVTILRMPTDIFPNIDIPVISVIFGYAGMSPEDMEGRIIGQFERLAITTVNDVERMESQSLYGIGIVKVFLHQGAKVEAATAELTAAAQTALRLLPPGAQPPLIMRYNASNVPVLQLSLASDTASEQQLFDTAVNVIRPQLITIPGVQIPWPYGGKQRQVMVDLDPARLYAWGISPSEVSVAVNAQNPILPAGTIKMGTQEYQVKLNSSPELASAINHMPVKTVNGTTVYVKDVAHVRDGFAVQTNVVNTNGKRGVLMPILKSGSASTLDVVSRIRGALPQILQTLPPGIRVTPLFDQSVFVRAAVRGVVQEALLAAGLTGLMILLFLGSWRSTLIVIISIPLSILVSIIVLAALGQTLNTMTLGGMALAVGILVDDATVEIENIHRNLHQHKRLVRAILDGAQQIAVPAFVSTTAICIVFVPVAFITGSAKFLFTPLAMAVVFAMMTSYFLSRTLVPTMVHYLLAAEVERYGGELDPHDPHAKHARERRAAGRLSRAAGRVSAGIWQVHGWVDGRFERLRSHYGALLQLALQHRRLVALVFSGLLLVSALLFPLIGYDFFPTVDAGMIRLHVRVPAGTRIEQTEHDFARVNEVIRSVIPSDEIDIAIDNIGIPYSGINLSLSDATLVSPADGEVLIALTTRHRPVAGYITELRRRLRERFPQYTFFFSPPDIATQVLNFGLSAPIDIQITGQPQMMMQNYAAAEALARKVDELPGVVDVRLHQVLHTPDIRVNVDRILAGEIGVTERQVAGDLLISLSSSTQTAPNFWLDPSSRVNYSILVQTPQYRVASLNALENTPIVPPGPAAAAGSSAQLLGNFARIERGISATNITHVNVTPSFDVLLGIEGSDLGSVAKKVRRAVDEAAPNLPRGSKVELRGQVESMRSSFSGLGYGLIFAVLLVYLLMVVNFQSWLDPFIILMALPGALAGILWMLFATNTTISVPALMGAIMTIGVATSNSILLITFANEQRRNGLDAIQAAFSAGMTRIRPVIMTALAMIIGMLPMSLGLTEGGEQNAPLGRAVIGGLLLATFATLFFVPVTYSVLRKTPPETEVEEELRR